MKHLWWRIVGRYQQWRDPIDVESIMSDFQARPKSGGGRVRRTRSGLGCPTPRKVAYGSLAAARNARGLRKNKGDRMRPYRCPCGSFHLTRRDA